MEKRRSARLTALTNATANEEPTIEAGKTKKKAAKDKKAPPVRGKRVLSSSKVENTTILTEERLDLSESSSSEKDFVPTKQNKKGKITLKEVKEESGSEDDFIPTKKQKTAVTQKKPDKTKELKEPFVKAKDFDTASKSSSSSLETFAASSDNEEKRKENESLLVAQRPASRNNPRRQSRASISYKVAVDSDSESGSDISSAESSEDEIEEKFAKKKNKNPTRKRKYEPSTEETSDSEEEDEDDGLDEEEIEEIRRANKKKAPRRGGGGSVSNKRAGTARTGSNGTKTPTNKIIKPWEKSLGGKNVCGDIVVPPRRLRRGEQKMLVFRILANQISSQSTKEIDIDEGYRLLDGIKAEFNADREGYVRRVLMTGGRDPDEETKMEEEEEEKKEAKEDGSSSSEDEWMEMEPVDAQDQNKLEVTVEGEEASGYDWWAHYLRQEVNKEIRKKFENTHKAHVLCFIAHLQYTVKALLHERTVPMLMVTQLPERLQKLQGEPLTKEMALQIAIWYSVSFSPAELPPDDGGDEADQFLYKETARFAYLAGKQRYEMDLERAGLLFALLVGFGATARICLNTRPIPRRWEELKNIKKPPKIKVEKEITAEDMKKMRGKKRKEAREKKLADTDYWVEYWNTKEKRWISIEPEKGVVDKPYEIEELTHKPIHYIFAVDDKRGVRDVSARYASDFPHPDFRRRRTNASWLTQTFSLDAVRANKQRAKLEDLHFRTEMINRPLPNTIGEYKNHPLYVLERHLLKFQALYPPASKQKALGEIGIKNEKIYPRDTVYTLLGEKKWEKLARSIKEGEKPYKMVKALTDPRIPKEERVEKELGVYGFWQTEPFRPLSCTNGVIPKNDYGNVYLYQPIMCPIGAVHLRLPGLPQIARKLGKECVPAVIGWEFNSCSNFPLIEGACVLEEDEKLFVAEWKKAEAEREAREIKKRQERALKNWKKFIQGVLRIHRVKSKFGHHTVVEEKDMKGKKKTAKKKKSGQKEEDEERPQNVIDKTSKPSTKAYTLHDVMGI